MIIHPQRSSVYTARAEGEAVACANVLPLCPDAYCVSLTPSYASCGCPMETLCAELDEIDGGHERGAAAVMGLIVDWAEGQFRLLGKRDACDLAMSLFAGIQGAALLANAFRDPGILTRQTRLLERWIDALASE